MPDKIITVADDGSCKKKTLRPYPAVTSPDGSVTITPVTGADGKITYTVKAKAAAGIDTVDLPFFSGTDSGSGKVDDYHYDFSKKRMLEGGGMTWDAGAKAIHVPIDGNYIIITQWDGRHNGVDTAPKDCTPTTQILHADGSLETVQGTLYSINGGASGAGGIQSGQDQAYTKSRIMALVAGDKIFSATMPGKGWGGHIKEGSGISVHMLPDKVLKNA